MRILLLSATYLECRHCFDWLDANPALPVDRLVSGIGQLAAGVAVQRQISFHRPEFILQAGIAGAAKVDDLGQVFAIGSEILADLGAEEPAGFQDLFDLNLAEPEMAPFRAGKLPNPWAKWLRFSGLDQRPGITVNQISNDKKLLVHRKLKYPSFVESMEGAALHYVALKENIPFLQIRAISNEAGERDKSRWLLKESIATLNNTLIPLIQKLVNADETHFGI